MASFRIERTHPVAGEEGGGEERRREAHTARPGSHSPQCRSPLSSGCVLLRSVAASTRANRRCIDPTTIIYFILGEGMKNTIQTMGSGGGGVGGRRGGARRRGGFDAFVVSGYVSGAGEALLAARAIPRGTLVLRVAPVTGIPYASELGVVCGGAPTAIIHSCVSSFHLSLAPAVARARLNLTPALTQQTRTPRIAALPY